METGKTPNLIIVTGGMEALPETQLAMINRIRETNPDIIVVSSPEEIKQLGIDKLKELPKENPFEKPPIYITNPYKENGYFTPPKTRQQRRAEERKNNKRK